MQEGALGEFCILWNEHGREFRVHVFECEGIEASETIHSLGPFMLPLSPAAEGRLEMEKD